MTVIRPASGRVRLSAPVPATASTRMISSGPYADELMLSELKIASAFVFVSRSCDSRSLWIGRPMRKVRSRRSAPRSPGRSRIVRSVATRRPSSKANSSSNGRTMRTYASPGRRPRFFCLTSSSGSTRGASSGEAGSSGRLLMRRVVKHSPRHAADPVHEVPPVSCGRRRSSWPTWPGRSSCSW